MDEFLNLLLNIPHLSPIQLLSCFFLAVMRFAPIAVFAPFFGGKVLPAIARMGLAIFLSIAFLPIVIGSATTAVGFDMFFLFLALKELLIGSVLAYLIMVPFNIVQSSGIIIDYQRGASQMMAQDPSQSLQASTIGILYNYLLIVIFFSLEGPFHFLDVVTETYRVIPVDGFLGARFFQLNVPFWQKSLLIMNHIFSMAIQMGAPALLAILMAETFLGIANRLAPQVQVAFLGMPLKSFMAILLMFIGWYVLIRAFGNEAMSWVKEMRSWIEEIPPYSS